MEIDKDNIPEGMFGEISETDLSMIRLIQYHKYYRWPDGARLVIYRYDNKVIVRTDYHLKGEGYRGVATYLRTPDDGWFPKYAISIEAVEMAAARCGNYIYSSGLGKRLEFEPFKEI